MKNRIVLAAALTAAAVSTVNAASRDYISVVGSSTVYPFATVVAENFGKTSAFKTPKIESTGSGGGFKLFCAGVGVEHPDITNASRRIKSSEVEKCASNGVTDVVEVKIGYDGIVMANAKSAEQMNLTRRDVFLALAKQVPNPKGGEALVDNPYKTWKEVNSALPDMAIEVLGPPPTSGTRDAFVELAMEGGCKSFDFIKAMKKKDKKAYKGICHTIREDGAFIEAGENDNLIVQKLESNPKAVGIFGFSFLDQNSDKVQGSLVDGIAPTFDAIADGSYPVSRPLYFYVKKAHVGKIPGIQEYLAEFTSDKSWGEEGYLVDKGMIPMPNQERNQFAADVKGLNVLKLTK
ncbi:MAG: PstS family phosphate ABC transporter substrate-binding protein [Sedimenticola sp.]|uniref:PstS family phosphate ABC transporter substrate-binding protein n=1 Tax=Sedimenticola thiotaurini TaxID=1543721 RepID=A0A558DGQ0_9GAMM|nr:PstS family phosphate ABC transporter substrate-binding protein [Sedimenticola sp.]MCW8882781.1 PstS family phosphate ABC transporter substrate-binding protein [Sedimenticola sp.]MCW8947015.1 PstS family phosphate ABC transporter substrate-binding protein [Sedimenticola sp.]MCW9022786.1 PstS family phosphate ABC transporter substrate-binding protein [Sedimenticola sp.]TVT60201.1 MAG: PstS family phosphate ABC transporter substrate-binding protein [Sedimenticola thiotaurini]